MSSGATDDGRIDVENTDGVVDPASPWATPAADPARLTDDRIAGLDGVGALAPVAHPVPLAGTWFEVGATGGGVLVAGGEVDLFARPLEQGRQTRRRFLARLGAGSVLPPVDGGDWILSLAPLPGAVVLPLIGTELDRLRAEVRASSDSGQGEPNAELVPLATSLVRGINLAITAISEANDLLRVPRDASVIPVGQMSALEAGATLIGDGGVTWIRLIGGSALRVGDPGQRRDPAGGPYVIAGREWLEAEADCAVQSETSWDLFRRDALNEAVSGHFAELVHLLTSRRAAEHDTWSQQVQDRKSARSEILTSVSESVRGAVVGQSVDSHDAAPPHVPPRA